MPYIIRIRRDTAANWTSNDPVLAAGELGLETDTDKLKAGDGTTAWSGLSYIAGGGGGGDVGTDTIWAAKGDLAVATANDTATVLSVGTNNQALVADSTTGTGLKWADIVNSVAGTTNEVTVSGSTGSVTIGLPDEITVVDLNTEHIDFDLTPTGPVQQGRLIWDATDAVLEYGLNANVNARIGTQLYKLCRNETGSTLTKGQVVYVTGSHGDIQLKVSLAQANAEATSAQTVGVVAESISNNSSGYVQTFGSLEGITTTGYTAGEPIYLSESTAGAFRSGLPAAPNHGVRVGFIVKVAGGGAGAIFINIQNYQELEELSDVTITSATSNDFLVYDTNKWVNKTAANSRTALGLGTLATQSGTFSGTSSGTNTGDQNIFQTIAVAGQNNVVADTTTDTLTLVAGTNITITTNDTTDSITIGSSTPNDVYAVFTALDNIAPASNMATLSTLNDLLVLDFDTGTAESAIFTGVLPNNADLTNGLSVTVHWTANNTTSSSTVEWKWEIASLATGNVTSRAYDTATVESKQYGTTTAYTIVTTTKTIANADTDGLAAGNAYAIKLTRNVTASGDDMGVDAKFIAMEVRKA